MLSDFGLREGLVLDWLANHRQEVSTLEQVVDLRMRSVLALLGDFFRGLGRGSLPFWVVLLGPYALLQATRLGLRLLR